MGSRGRILFILSLIAVVAMVQPAAAETGAADSNCDVANAAGPAAAGPATGGGGGTQRGKKKKKRKKATKVSLQADPQSASRVVNLGDDREAEEVTLRVNVSPSLPPNYEKRLEVVAEPFANSSETGETVTFSEPTFSALEVSGNRKRITFTMCIDPPNDLPAGKY